MARPALHRHLLPTGDGDSGVAWLPREVPHRAVGPAKSGTSSARVRLWGCCRTRRSARPARSRGEHQDVEKLRMIATTRTTRRARMQKLRPTHATVVATISNRPRGAHPAVGAVGGCGGAPGASSRSSTSEEYSRTFGDRSNAAPSMSRPTNSSFLVGHLLWNLRTDGIGAAVPQNFGQLPLLALYNWLAVRSRLPVHPMAGKSHLASRHMPTCTPAWCSYRSSRSQLLHTLAVGMLRVPQRGKPCQWDASAPGTESQRRLPGWPPQTRNPRLPGWPRSHPMATFPSPVRLGRSTTDRLQKRSRRWRSAR